jgi:transposase-like protein
MPYAYSPEYREMVCEQIRAGRPVGDVAGSLEVSEATVYRWKAQDSVDRGVRPGLTTAEAADLRAARVRIAELEAELAATKRASELFAEGRVVRPKVLYPIVDRLAAEGHSCKAACRLLGVAPSGFFRWRTRPVSARQLRRAWLSDVVMQIWEESRQTYGARQWWRVPMIVDSRCESQAAFSDCCRFSNSMGETLPIDEWRRITGAPTFGTSQLIRGYKHLPMRFV